MLRYYKMGCGKSTADRGSKALKSSVVKVHQAKPADKGVKVILIGASMVGKSSICQHCRGGPYLPYHNATVTPAYQEMVVNTHKGRAVTLKIWDTAGQEKFKSINRIFFRGADIALLVYDVTSPQTFKDLDFWADELRGMLEEEGLIMCLVGNKIDLQYERRVTKEQAEQKVKQIGGGCLYHQTSVVTGEGVEELVQRITEEYMGRSQ